MSTTMKDLLAFLLIWICVDNSAAQWKPVPSTAPPAALFAHDTDVFVSVKGGGVYRFIPRQRSSNKIASDSGILPGQTDKGISGFAVAGPYLFASGPGVNRSTDNGKTWTLLMSTFPRDVSALGAIDTILLTSNNKLRRSTDYGNSWAAGLDETIGIFGTLGNNVFGTGGNGFWHSTDSGANWLRTPKVGGGRYFAIGESDIFVGDNTIDNYLYRSSDLGNSWDSIPLPTYPRAIAGFGPHLFVGSDKSVLYVSHDRGATWSLVNDGITDIVDINVMCVCDSFLIVGGGNHLGRAIWYRPISEMLRKDAVASIQPPNAETFTVYPNPFNSSCSVSFSLASGGPVSITVLDATGRVVAMPFDGTLEPGEHTAPFDATHLPSGIYWCRLTAEGKQRVAKITMLK
jgi:hypothetical protein